MIKIGGQVGAINTVALIFLTAIIGIFFAKRQGIQTLRSGLINIYQNKVPINEIISGTSIAIAAFLLIVPGFFTDFLGFLLLIPFTRKILLKLALKNKTKMDIRSQNKTIEGEIIDNKKERINRNLVVDSLDVARNKFPGASNSLDALCKRFNIDLSRRTKHNALLDCELLREVYINLLDAKEPKFNLSTNISEQNIIKSKDYGRKIIKISEEELKKYNKFIKTELKKNFY